MIRFIDMGDAIKDRETGFSFPKDETHHRYRDDYLPWLNAGNVPVPEQPGPDYVLDGDAWILDATISADIARAEAEIYLKETDALVQSYKDAITAGRTPAFPSSKFQNLLKRRARAQKKLTKTFADF